MKKVIIGLVSTLAWAGCAFEHVDDEPMSAASQAIVGGTEVSQAQYNQHFPWMLAFGVSDFPFWDQTTQQNGVWCGAVLVSPQWAITSGHCVLSDYTDPNTLLPLSTLKVARGAAKSSQMSDAINGSTTVGVTKVIVHPWYMPNYAPDYDIALLRLSAPLPGPYAPLETQATGPDVPALIIGWGSTIAQNADTTPFEDPQDWPDSLRQAYVRTVSNDECAASYSVDSPETELDETEYTITPRMVCATGVGLGVGGATSGACFADSGGPLLVHSGGSWRVTGLTSSGANCAQPGYPETYQRVTGSIGQWITACQIKSVGGNCTLNH